MSGWLGRLRQDERGVAMVLVVFAVVILSVLGITLLQLVESEQKRSATSVTSQTSFQAAEAGIDDYLAKLVDNRVYYLQYIHPAESTRRDTVSGTTLGVAGACTSSSKPPPAAWGLGREWTSPNGKDRWCELTGGFEYNLQITAPQTPGNLTDGIQIVATGRKLGSTTDLRTIQVLVDPTSVADYQMLSASSITYGNDATTTGKLYSAVNICHQGVAWANLYADGSITCTPSLQGGAVTYNSATIPTPPSGTNFAALQVALIDVKRAADTGGLNLDNYATIPSPDEHGWRLTFQADGSILAESCRQNGASDLADVTPVCGGAGAWSATLSMPSNGAIYATKTVIISGPGASGINGPSTVNGRVTVASNDDIVVAGNINYVNPVACGCGDDVLGMIGLNSVYVADWAPNQLTWRGASLAETYQWRAWDCNGVTGRTGATPQSTMTYYGSTITNGTTPNPDPTDPGPNSTGGGCMSSYDKRNYNYDATLLYLPPPWFPTIDTPYKILLFRELQAGV